jgi:hypothetical protein
VRGRNLPSRLRFGVLFPAATCSSAGARISPFAVGAALLQSRKVLRSVCMELIQSWKAKAGGVADGADPKAVTNGSANRDAKAPAGGGVAPGSFLGLMLSARERGGGGGALSDDEVAAQVGAHSGACDCGRTRGGACVSSERLPSPARPGAAACCDLRGVACGCARVAGAQVQTFILAGYETTANALAFAVYCLATNPEVRARHPARTRAEQNAGARVDSRANVQRIHETRLWS